MGNLAKFEAFKLNKVQMNEVNGGISKAQYCKEIMALANAHDDKSWSAAEWDSWADAYSKNCG